MKMKTGSSFGQVQSFKKNITRISVYKNFYILIFILSFTFFLSGNSFAIDRFMAKTGTNTGNCVSSPCATLQYSMSQMAAGDTLIIDDGIYTGAANQMTNSAHPPTSSTLWTTIKAKNDGAVTFDGETIRCMFSVTKGSLTNVHWRFEGIVWGRSTSSVVEINSLSYVKFLRCGGYDAGAGNANIFFAGRCSYVLFDGCYAWGNGRTSFTAWSSDVNNDYIIFRNCVSRIDRSSSAPIYNFGMYSVQHGLIQNCIAIDTDQPSQYYTGGDWSGGIAVPSTDRDANDIKAYNSIVLNSNIGGVFTTKNTYSTNDVGFHNSVVAGISNKSGANLNSFRGNRNIIDHVTFVNGTGGYIGLNAWPWTGSPNGGVNMTNSIIANYTGSSNGTTYGIAGDYQALHGNSTPLSMDSTPLGTHSKTSVNPIWNASTNPTGALKYITRIEPGSNLSGQGSSGDIGANLTTLRGTTGALWGETGYDSDTGISMWPYPNEALIQAKMSTYTGGGVNGARGFCATGKTLTNYIWGYLGNAAPASSTSPAPPTIPSPMLQSINIQ
ncbi:hypothetical protein [uncultured Desulfobulbus sp.]|uniref:hypothetical protein n=1 Tax=uncultured Desulfobulbus sp. TaxID=239745 RepID=UPI0029C77E76|nr:hypothetical protein [uncultured Desulfobulbus sp.]